MKCPKYSWLGLVVICWILGQAAEAKAEESLGPESIDLEVSQLIRVPSAWLPKADILTMHLALDQGLRPVGGVSVGLAGIAEVGVDVQSERLSCLACQASDGLKQTQIRTKAFFKMATPQGFVHPWLPALALVYTKQLVRPLSTVNLDGVDVAGEATFISVHKLNHRYASMALLASKGFGPIALHTGLSMMVAEEDKDPGEQKQREGMSHTLRPIFGMQWRPTKFPKSVFLADLVWEARAPLATQKGRWKPVWKAAIGLRYQAYTTVAVDLNLKFEEEQGLEKALVTLGLRGQFGVR